MANQPVVQTFYVPLQEDQLLQALLSIQPLPDPLDPFAAPGPQSPVQTYISIASVADNTVLYYDHGEDGYELDLSNPTQATTQIFGDGDLTNGIAPGFADDRLQAGDVVVLNNPVDTSNLAAIDFDGGDKIGASRPIAATRAAWATGPDTRLAGALEVYDTQSFGQSYILPVGEDTRAGADVSDQLFQYSGLSVLAAEDGTTVTIDANNGDPSQVISLDQGQSFLVNGGLNAGATVTSTAPIQVDLLTGDRGPILNLVGSHCCPRTNGAIVTTRQSALITFRAGVVWI